VELSHIGVDEHNGKNDSGFQVELRLSPDPNAEERLKRAFSLVLRASKQASDSNKPDPPTAPNKMVGSDPSNF